MLSYWAALKWIYGYYYQGCISWNWYFPFHYSPFASDLCMHKEDLKKIEDIKFELSKPFTPFQ